MEGLTFKKLNEYQTLVTSENHQVILTDIIKKYARTLMKAKIHAVIAIILIAISAVLAVVFTHRAAVYYSGISGMFPVIGSVIVAIMSASIFNSSMWDIKKFTKFIDEYKE